jgi:hypothetical protein
MAVKLFEMLAGAIEELRGGRVPRLLIAMEEMKARERACEARNARAALPAGPPPAGALAMAQPAETPRAVPPSGGARPALRGVAMPSSQQRPAAPPPATGPPSAGPPSAEPQPAGAPPGPPSSGPARAVMLALVGPSPAGPPPGGPPPSGPPPAGLQPNVPPPAGPPPVRLTQVEVLQRIVDMRSRGALSSQLTERIDTRDGLSELTYAYEFLNEAMVWRMDCELDPAALATVDRFLLSLTGSINQAHAAGVQLQPTARVGGTSDASRDVAAGVVAQVPLALRPATLIANKSGGESGGKRCSRLTAMRYKTHSRKSWRFAKVILVVIAQFRNLLNNVSIVSPIARPTPGRNMPEFRRRQRSICPIACIQPTKSAGRLSRCPYSLRNREMSRHALSNPHSAS